MGWMALSHFQKWCIVQTSRYNALVNNKKSRFSFCPKRFTFYFIHCPSTCDLMILTQMVSTNRFKIHIISTGSISSLLVFIQKKKLVGEKENFWLLHLRALGVRKMEEKIWSNLFLCLTRLRLSLFLKTQVPNWFN